MMQAHELFTNGDLEGARKKALRLQRIAETDEQVAAANTLLQTFNAAIAKQVEAEVEAERLQAEAAAAAERELREAEARHKAEQEAEAERVRAEQEAEAERIERELQAEREADARLAEARAKAAKDAEELAARMKAQEEEEARQQAMREAEEAAARQAELDAQNERTARLIEEADTDIAGDTDVVVSADAADDTDVADDKVAVFEARATQVIKAGFGGIQLPDSFKQTLPSGEVTAEDVERMASLVRQPVRNQHQVIRVLGDPVNGLRVAEEATMELHAMENLIMPSMMQILVRRSSNGVLRAERGVCPEYPRTRTRATRGNCSWENHPVQYPVRVFIGRTDMVDKYLFPNEQWRLLTVFRAPYGVWFLETDLDGSNPDALTTAFPRFEGRSGYGAKARLFAFLLGRNYRRFMSKDKRNDFAFPAREYRSIPYETHCEVGGQVIKEVGLHKNKLPEAIGKAWMQCIMNAWIAGGYDPRREDCVHIPPNGSMRPLTLTDFRTNASAFPLPVDPKYREAMIPLLPPDKPVF